MLFNSLTFVVFFAIVVIAYWSIRSWNARKNLLVVASYVFYGAWNPPFAALLFSTTAMDFWLRQTNCEGQGSAFVSHMAGWQRLHEPEHARFFQIRKFSTAKFPVAARADRHHLSTTASRHSSARRHFLLYVSFSLLHARHLSRRFEADEVTPRFHPGGFLFSSASRRANCARRRFSPATC